MTFDPTRQLSTLVLQPAGGWSVVELLEMAENKSLQSMRILKKRIIMTDELIGKYKEKVEENEKCQHQVKEQSHCVHSLQSAIHGLKREIDCLHKEKEIFLSEREGRKLELEKLKQENERLRWSLLSEEQTNKSLLKELQRAQSSQLENVNLLSENRDLIMEKEKWKEMYQKLRKENDILNDFDTSLANNTYNSQSNINLAPLPLPCSGVDPPSANISAESSPIEVTNSSSDKISTTINQVSVFPHGDAHPMSGRIPHEFSIVSKTRCDAEQVYYVGTQKSSTTEVININGDDSDDDEELETIFSEFSPLIGLSPLPPSPVIYHEEPSVVKTTVTEDSLLQQSCHEEPSVVKTSITEGSLLQQSGDQSSSFVRAPTLSPLPPSPVSMSSCASPIPNSPTELTLCLSPPLSSDAHLTDVLEVQSNNSSSWKNVQSTALLSPLSLSPSLSPLSPLQQPTSDNSLSPLPLTPAVSPLSPLHQPTPSGSYFEVKTEIEKTVPKCNKIPNLSQSVGYSASDRKINQSADLSIAQRELCAAMQCPLPLPSWLVSAIAAVQDMHEHCLLRNWGKKGKKKKIRNHRNKTWPVFRKEDQAPQYYVFNNLQLLVSNQIHLSTVITMFIDVTSVPSSQDVTAGLIQFFQEVYRPNIDHVLALFHDQCKKLRTNTAVADALDPSFVPALLRPECQLVMLLAHMCRLSPVMANLLHESCWVLQQAIMKRRINFHKLLAMSRVLTALLRLQNDSERLQCFMADLLKKPILPNELYVIVGIGSIWPTPFNRKKSLPLQKLQVVNLRSLEETMLRTTLEVAVFHKYHSEGVKAGIHEAFPKNLQTYYGWNFSLQIDQLAESLLQILQTSKNVSIDLTPMSLRPWQRPRPSVVAYQLVYCITVLAASKKWSWTYTFLIDKHLWPMLQQWRSTNTTITSEEKMLEGTQETSVVSDAIIVCVLRLLGFLCTIGLKEDSISTSMEEIRGVMIILLKESSSNTNVTLPMQLAALDSLLEMTPVKHAQYSHVANTVKSWLRAQELREWFYPLHTEIKQRFNLTI